MICLDSWVWLEYLFEGDSWRDAEAAIENANSPSVGGIVPATVVTEVSYQIRRRMNTWTAEETINAIRGFEHIELLPVTDEIAEYAAALRAKYCQPGDRELSYADAIHLAVAVVVTECDRLYSGNPAFKGVDEIETVIL